MTYLKFLHFQEVSVSGNNFSVIALHIVPVLRGYITTELKMYRFVRSNVIYVQTVIEFIILLKEH